MNLEDWPDCAVKGCPHKCCLRLRSRYCWPHTTLRTPNDEVMESLMEENIPGVMFFSTVGNPEKW